MNNKKFYKVKDIYGRYYNKLESINDEDLKVLHKSVSTAADAIQPFGREFSLAWKDLNQKSMRLAEIIEARKEKRVIK